MVAAQESKALTDRIEQVELAIKLLRDASAYVIGSIAF